MNKRVSREVTVKLGKSHQPLAFKWRERMYHIREVQECWRFVGAWWDGESEKTFFRIATDSGGIYELCYDHGEDRWAILVVRD